LGWIPFLLKQDKFDRGYARAVEELLGDVTLYAAAGEEKFRDKYRLLTKGMKQVVKHKLLVAEFLMKRYKTFNLDFSALWELDNKYKAEARTFLRNQLGNTIQARNQIKEVFRKPKSSRREYAEDDYH